MSIDTATLHHRLDQIEQRLLDKHPRAARDPHLDAMLRTLRDEIPRPVPGIPASEHMHPAGPWFMSDLIEHLRAEHPHQDAEARARFVCLEREAGRTLADALVLWHDVMHEPC